MQEYSTPDWWETWCEDNFRKKLTRWNKTHQESKVVINVPEVVAKIKNAVAAPVLRIIPQYFRISKNFAELIGTATLVPTFSSNSGLPSKTTK